MKQEIWGRLKGSKGRVSNDPFLFGFIGMKRVKDKDLTPYSA